MLPHIKVLNSNNDEFTKCKARYGKQEFVSPLLAYSCEKTENMVRVDFALKKVLNATTSTLNTCWGHYVGWIKLKLVFHFPHRCVKKSITLFGLMRHIKVPYSTNFEPNKL